MGSPWRRLAPTLRNKEGLPRPRGSSGSHGQIAGGLSWIRAQDAQGRFYNIEVQVEREDGYVERSVYYAAELLTSQLQKGQPFTKLAPTIGISLLDFVLFPRQDDLHSVYVLYDIAHQHKLSDVLEMHYIEMVKFKENKPHRLRTPFEKWLHILKYGELYDGDRGAIEGHEE